MKGGDRRIEEKGGKSPAVRFRKRKPAINGKTRVQRRAAL